MLLIFNDYIKALGTAADLHIKSFDDLCEALQKRMDYFHAYGCSIADHGLEYIPFREAPQSEIERIFSKRRTGSQLEREESEKFQTATITFFGEKNTIDWVGCNSFIWERCEITTVACLKN